MKKRTPNNTTSNYLTKQEAAEYFAIGTASVEKLAKASGSKIKLGRVARYDRERMEEYFRKQVAEN